MSKPLNRWYTAEPWRPEGGQRHHATSSAVSTFQLASRSTNSFGRSYQFFLTNTCVRPIIFVHTIPFFSLFSLKNLLPSTKLFTLSSWKLSFSQHERASCFRGTERLVLFPRASRFSDIITRKSHGICLKNRYIDIMISKKKSAFRSLLDHVAIVSGTSVIRVASRMSAICELSPLQTFTPASPHRCNGECTARKSDLAGGVSARTDTTWSWQITGWVTVTLAIVPFSDSSVRGRHCDGRWTTPPWLYRSEGCFIPPRLFSTAFSSANHPEHATCTTTAGHCSLTATCPINHSVYTYIQIQPSCGKRVVKLLGEEEELWGYNCKR